MLAGVGHALVVVVEAGAHFVVIQVEILRLEGWGKGTDSFQRSAPQAGHHVDGEGQRRQCQEEAGNADARLVAVVRELQLPKQVKAEQAEQHNPQRQEGLAVQQMPAVGQVGYRKEFQREGQFEESERDFYRVHPPAGPGHRLEPRGEQGEQREGQSQGERESQHAQRGCHYAAGGGYFHQEEAYDGACA